jgi:hypothetical protein
MSCAKMVSCALVVPAKWTTALYRQISLLLLNPQTYGVRVGDEGYTVEFTSHLAEAEKLARLNHANVVRCFGWCEVNYRVFLIMERAKCDLSEWDKVFFGVGFWDLSSPVFVNSLLLQPCAPHKTANSSRSRDLTFSIVLTFVTTHTHTHTPQGWA